MLDRPMNQWGERDFLRRAYIFARDYSIDPSTQCGAILVPVSSNGTNLVTFGVNRFPKGVKCTPELLANREKKLFRIEHAERDAIFKAAMQGFPTLNATLYCPWYACSECAKAIIGAGIKRVVGHTTVMEKTPDRWMVTIREADEMLDDAGVIRDYLEGDLFDGDPDYSVLFDGRKFIP